MTEQRIPPEGNPPSQDNHSDEIEQGFASRGMNLLAKVTSLAWNLVIPIIGGVLLGYYLDQRFGGELTWTLSLLVLGIIIAFSNLYNLYIEHGRENIPFEEEMKKKREIDEEK